jgi:hypothetical protein
MTRFFPVTIAFVALSIFGLMDDKAMAQSKKPNIVVI